MLSLIQTSHSELAGKIPGMLLEVGDCKLLHTPRSPARVGEAIGQAHQANKEVARRWVLLML